MKNAPTIKPPEWSRTDMLLYGGTSWFHILIATYLIQAGAIITLNGGAVATGKMVPLWVPAGNILSGSLMFVGLFVRPAWRDWRWILITGLALLTQGSYAYHYWRVAPFLEALDESTFTLFLAASFFRAVFDTLVRHELRRSIGTPEHLTAVPK